LSSSPPGISKRQAKKVLLPKAANLGFGVYGLCVFQ
jgi:hypothetical protein